MNQNLMKIFDVCKKFQQDPLIGPCSKTTFNDFIFGIEPQPKKIPDKNGKYWKGYLGYMGWEYSNKMDTFSKKSTNIYDIDFNGYNYSPDIVNHWESEQTKCYEKYTKELFRDIYNLANETKTYQSDFSRCLGIPATFSKSKTQSCRMIAELLYRAEHIGLITTEKIGRSRYIYPGNLSKIPLNSYNLNFKLSKRSSKYEAYVSNILKHIPGIIAKWQIRLPEYKNAPYDFGIFDADDNLIGMLEVQGEQHSRRIDFFHKTEGDFQRRLDIDRKKKEIVLSNELIYLEIDANTLQQNSSKQIKHLIYNTFVNV